MARQRLVSAAAESPAEEAQTTSLRPTRLDDYVGQPRLIEKLRITLEAVRSRGEPMEHLLLHGPPGLGKTTLAHIVAREMGSHVTVTSGPALSRPTDLVGTLTKLQPRDVLFIDEIHRLSPVIEEYIYPAMEDYRIDVTVDQGMHAKTITLPLQPFTLIGATTRAGLLSGPMRSRFGITHNLEFYGEADLRRILTRSARLLGLWGDDESDPAIQRSSDRDKTGDAVSHTRSLDHSIAGSLPPDHSITRSLHAIASRSRGTPRVANRLLRRVRDFAQVRGDGALAPPLVDEALRLEGVDRLGLDDLDRRYLQTLGRTYEGGPAGLEAIAATMGEDAGTLEEMVEPFLLQIGFLARTRRGRQLTRQGGDHVGVALPDAEENDAGDGALFE